MAVVYHGTPMTPRIAAQTVLSGRAVCVSFYRPDTVDVAEAVSPFIMYDNGAFSFWKQALRSGKEWDETQRDWQPYYDWLERRLFSPGRWAVIPDQPGAPSQLNDSLLNDWPFGTSRGAPLWHMDASVDRLGRLCDRYDRVCIGYVGPEKSVDCPAYHERMEEVSGFLGNRWPVLHMMRGTAVAGLYPFTSADSTSLAQNGHRHDWRDYQADILRDVAPAQWSGRSHYADQLEALAA